MGRTKPQKPEPVVLGDEPILIRADDTNAVGWRADLQGPTVPKLGESRCEQASQPPQIDAVIIDADRSSASLFGPESSLIQALDGRPEGHVKTGAR